MLYYNDPKEMLKVFDDLMFTLTIYQKEKIRKIQKW